MDRPTAALIAPHRLKLLGGATLHSSAGPITGRAVQRHRLALLALLASNRRPRRARDQLIALLWPEAGEERGRKLLSDSIYRINQALGGEAIGTFGEDLGLNPDLVQSDVGDLEVVAAAGEWRRVVDLYAGPFLDGLYLPNAAEFDQWMEIERARHARTAARAMEALAVEAAGAGRPAEVADWWQRLATLAPEDSRVALELMKALDAAGNRAGAVRHARIHTTLLRETLGVDADPAVRSFAEQLAARTDLEPVDPPPEPPAQVTPHAPAPAPAEPIPDSVDMSEKRRWPAAIVVAVALVAIVALALKPGRRDDTVPKTPALGNAIAVLPFANVSGADSNAYFADGMSEELMYLLTRIPGLRVASPTSAFAYRDRNLDVREVARRLRVDWILGGSVRRSGSQLRIVAQLTDARNGYQVWAESFDRSASDIFAIQQEIAVAISRRLGALVGGAVGTAPPPDTNGPSAPRVYDRYLQARFQWHRRTEASLRSSVRLFEEVVASEPRYARAWAGLGDAYAVAAFYDYLPPRMAYPKADSAARRAIALDSTLAAPHATLAYVDTYYRWDGESAERGFQRAIELEPTYSTAHQWYSNLLTALGRFDEAERAMRRAAELDPLSLIAHAAIGWVLLLADRNDEAIEQLRGALELDSTFQLGHYWLGIASEQRGQPADAIRSLERALALSHGNPLVLTALAHAHASAGRGDSARAILDGLVAREAVGLYLPSYEMGKAYQALGDIPAALMRLERAYRDRAHSIAFLKVDPQLRPLAAEPRFRKLVEQVDRPTRDPEPD